MFAQKKKEPPARLPHDMHAGETPSRYPGDILSVIIICDYVSNVNSCFETNFGLYYTQRYLMESYNSERWEQTTVAVRYARNFEQKTILLEHSWKIYGKVEMLCCSLMKNIIYNNYKY